MIPVWEVQTAPATDERANPKVFVLERGLEPQGNIKITFVPLMHGDHPSPGSLPIVGVQWTNWGRNLHAMVYIHIMLKYSNFFSRKPCFVLERKKIWSKL